MFLFCFLPGNYFHFCQELFSGDLGQEETERKRTRLVETCFNDCKFHIVKGSDKYRRFSCRCRVGLNYSFTRRNK